MSFSYANATSGPSAGGVGWFNFGNLTMNPGDTVTGLTGILNNGNIVTFDLSLALASGQPRTFAATSVPVYPGANFGTTGYTGIAGNAALHANYNFAGPGMNALTLSNITVKTPGGNPVSNYTVVVADAETTNTGEVWSWSTNGGVWNLLATLGGNPPMLTGLGTQTAIITGNQLFPQASQAANVLTTQAPTQLTLVSTETATGRQAVSIGFATTHMKVQKYVAGRIDNADQFQLDIAGTPADQTITSGVISGMQTQIVEVFATPNNTYGISEAMAVGSASLLSDYTTIVSASNATPAGSIPPTGNLPINFTIALGDDVIYTIYNSIPHTYTKTVDKAYSDIGELLTYTVAIDNPNDFPVANVLFQDPTPPGTTYMGNLIVSQPYTGTDPANGLVITSIPANGSVTISWQVQINTAPPVSTPVVNVALVVIPGGNSGVTNMVTTAVRTAYVTVNKLVNKEFSKPNDVLTYTLMLNNAGNVPAYNVVITDAIPSGATFVSGSLVGASGTLPMLTLNAPIMAGGTATVTYQVKIGNVVPVPNPIPNNVSLVYSYTVDPAQPLGASKTAQSNTVTTLVNEAKLSIIKSTDKIVSYIGDTITYQLEVKNTGNVPVNNAVITDVLAAGTVYNPGSLVVSVPAIGDLPGAIALVDPIAPGQTVSVSFKVLVTAIPNPNPIVNVADATFTYTVDPAQPNAESDTGKSNAVTIVVLRNNYGQQISDLIESVALEQAALAAIVNAEGEKIQRMAAMPDVTSQQLLCLNKSVSEMMDSMAMLEAVLRQKLSIVDCQIDGETC